MPSTEEIVSFEQGFGGRSCPMPSVDDIMKYEDGDMDTEEVITFFQGLIDSGMAWSLQGSYGRTASALIEGGYCRG